MCIKTAIVEYTLIDFMLAEAVAVTVVPSVLVIGKRVRRAVAEWVPL